MPARDERFLCNPYPDRAVHNWARMTLQHLLRFKLTCSRCSAKNETDSDAA